VIAVFDVLPYRFKFGYCMIQAALDTGENFTFCTCHFFSKLFMSVRHVMPCAYLSKLGLGQFLVLILSLNVGFL